LAALRWARFVVGLFISALGSVLTIRASLGISPWDVLHDGVSQRTPLSFGTSVIAVSIVVVAISWAIGIVPGAGTLVNMIGIGAFDDLLLMSGVGNSVAGSPLGLELLVLGLGVGLIGFGAAVYIGAGLGAGPRDSLQLAVTLRAGVRPGVARAIVEGSALLAGWLLGGAVGLGTVVSVVLISVAVDLSFAVLRVDPAGRKTAAVIAG
jgi:uncharacterized membrane protein YczE